MPRIPIKSTEKLENAKKRGELNAEMQAWKKEPATYKAYKIFEKLLANVDIMESMAILGSTVVVHDVVLKTKEFTDALEPVVKNSGFGLIASPIFSWLTGFVPEWFPTQPDPEGTIKPVDLTDDLRGQVLLWLISFAIAYFAIKHGAEILGTAKSFFGITGALA